MKSFVMLTMFFFLSIAISAHEGEDHGSEKKTTILAMKYFSSEALSDKYEVLVKYGALEAKKESRLQLFISDARTNKAIDSATVTVKVLNQPKIQLTLKRIDAGIFQLTGIFPDNEVYDLQCNISSSIGPDFLQVSKIEVGKKLETVVMEEHQHWYSNTWVWAVIGLFAGTILMYLLMKGRHKKVAMAVMIFSLLIPISNINPVAAHGGEDHGTGSSKSGGISHSFLIEKESQFLFDIRTQKVGGGNFYQSAEILGTVTASPQGMAVIQTPQSGKIVSLRINPGQTVVKGQTLAIIEQQIEAGTQINLISQRNELNAEVKAAKAQYDRLLGIADIAAKKDVTEARARYEAARQNLELFNSNLGAGMGSSKMIALTSPISGVVGTFNYAIGAVVNSGETLFEITNLNKVYVETQVFAADMNDQNKASRFEAFSNYDTATYALRMVSVAQEVNTTNQAQRIIFEVIHPAGKFKIGENVRVLKYGNNRIAQLVVPTSAIIDIGGKPAVFIKDKAEQMSISFIQKGESNAIYTAIARGVETGERVITGNVYQVKMIYLGQ